MGPRRGLVLPSFAPFDSLVRSRPSKLMRRLLHTSSPDSKSPHAPQDLVCDVFGATAVLHFSEIASLYPTTPYVVRFNAALDGLGITITGWQRRAPRSRRLSSSRQKSTLEADFRNKLISELVKQNQRRAELNSQVSAKLERLVMAVSQQHEPSAGARTPLAGASPADELDEGDRGGEIRQRHAFLRKWAIAHDGSYTACGTFCCNRRCGAHRYLASDFTTAELSSDSCVCFPQAKRCCRWSSDVRT